MNTLKIKSLSPWPYAILLSFVLLASFDAYIVTKAIQTSTASITTKPYEMGLIYEERIHAKEAAAKAGIKMSIDQSGTGLLFSFTNLEPNPKTLKLRMVKPDDSNLDREFELRSKENEFSTTKENLKEGLWFVEATLTYDNIDSPSYFFETREMIK